MNGKIFLQLVEIRTKIASMLPLLFGTLYALYRYGKLEMKQLILMFFSLLLFDMTTTAINNLMDYMKSDDPHYREDHNIMGIGHLKKREVLATILIMLTGAILCGIYLVLLTDVVVLFLGMASFFVGIFYTFGPIPISRMPLGELLSGSFMGFVIIYLAVYIHEPSIASFTLLNNYLSIRIDLWETLAIFLVSLPFVFAISNLMLANNICDLDQDIKNDRYLLPYFVGKKHSLTIFRLSYYGAYISVVVSVILGYLPLISLLTLLSFYWVNGNINLFYKEQIKSKTFITSVKNLTILGISHIGPLILALFLPVR